MIQIIYLLKFFIEYSDDLLLKEEGKCVLLSNSMQCLWVTVIGVSNFNLMLYIVYDK